MKIKNIDEINALLRELAEETKPAVDDNLEMDIQSLIELNNINSRPIRQYAMM